MKTTITSLLLSLSILAAPARAADAPREFAVSRMGQSTEAKAQFLKLWAALQDSREPAAEEIRFEVRKPVTRYGRPQPLHAYEVALEGGVIAVVEIPAAGLAKGTRARAVVVKATEWDTNLRAGNADRPLYREAAKVTPPTKEEFLALIRAGRTFPVLLAESCRGCMGDGLRSALQDAAQCEDCFGTGTGSARWVVRN